MELAAIFFGWLALSLSRNRRNDSEINVKYKIIEILLLIIVAGPVVLSPDPERQIVEHPVKFFIALTIVLLYIYNQFRKKKNYSKKVEVFYIIAIIPTIYLVWGCVVEWNANYQSLKPINIASQIIISLIAALFYHLCFFRNVRRIFLIITFFTFIAASFVALYQLREIRSRQIYEDVAKVSRSLPMKLDDITTFSSLKFDGERWISTYILDGSVNEGNIKELTDIKQFKKYQCIKIKDATKRGIEFRSIILYQTGKIANQIEFDRSTC